MGLLPTPAELAAHLADRNLARRGFAGKSAAAVMERESLIRFYLPLAEGVTAGFTPLAEAIERVGESVRRLSEADVVQKAAQASQFADLAAHRGVQRPADPGTEAA